MHGRTNPLWSFYGTILGRQQVTPETSHLAWKGRGSAQKADMKPCRKLKGDKISQRWEYTERMLNQYGTQQLELEVGQAQETLKEITTFLKKQGNRQKELLQMRIRINTQTISGPCQLIRPSLVVGKGRRRGHTLDGAGCENEGTKNERGLQRWGSTKERGDMRRVAGRRNTSSLGKVSSKEKHQVYDWTLFSCISFLPEAVSHIPLS